ncbi:MAG: hypothetical protein ACRDRN_23380 [Sciscionella sp.]
MSSTRGVVLAWCHEFDNIKRRHGSAAWLAPDEYEKIAAIQPESGIRNRPLFEGKFSFGVACMFFCFSFSLGSSTERT